MNHPFIIVIVLAMLTLLYDIYNKKKEKETIDRLTQLLVQQQYQQFDEIVDTIQVRKYFAQFNHLFLKLNKEILANNTEKAEQLMDQLLTIKLSNRQKEAFYSKAFYYFVAKKDYEMVKEYHQRYMNECKNNKEEIDRVYDTIIAKGYRYLDASLQQLANASKPVQIQLYSLIATMYENKNDKQRAEQYTAKLKQLIDEFAENKK